MCVQVGGAATAFHCGIRDVSLIITAVILPPAAVCLRFGCGADFLINLLLTILGYFPGTYHTIPYHTIESLHHSLMLKNNGVVLVWYVKTGLLHAIWILGKRTGDEVYNPITSPAHTTGIHTHHHHHPSYATTTTTTPPAAATSRLPTAPTAPSRPSSQSQS
jgi:uncharacterized membrane protein YqaE (UPF0057 family)